MPLRRPSLPAIPPLGPGLGRVAYADAEQHRDILQSLVRNLLRARRTIWLATPYFLPTWRVRRALRRAAKHGVDVRLLLTGRNTDHAPVRYAGRRYYPRLLKAGVRIFEYQPRFLHLKMVLVDDWVSLGSCNFDHWNLRWNLDANLEAFDPQLADRGSRQLHGRLRPGGRSDPGRLAGHAAGRAHSHTSVGLARPVGDQPVRSAPLTRTFGGCLLWHGWLSSRDNH